MSAYLVVREGTQSQPNVHRLTTGKATTIGRAPSNAIVVTNEVCSRHHCEVYSRDGEWFVRDLQSRNGTLLDSEPFEGEVPLKTGQVVRIGPCELVFTFDLAAIYQAESSREASEMETAESPIGGLIDTVPLGGEPEPTILGSARRNPFISGERTKMVEPYRPGRELAQLYRLALEMGKATNPKQLAEAVLTGLATGTPANIAALLLLPEPTAQTAEP